MKFCAIPKGLSSALDGLASKIKKDKEETAIIGSEDEALVVMSWDKYQELVAAANKPASKEYYPYAPTPWRYWYTTPYWTNPYWSITAPPTNTYSITTSTTIPSNAYTYSVSAISDQTTYQSSTADYVNPIKDALNAKELTWTDI